MIFFSPSSSFDFEICFGNIVFYNVPPKPQFTRQLNVLKIENASNLNFATQLFLLLESDDDTVIRVLEPLDCVHLSDELSLSDVACGVFASCDSASSAGQHNVEVHAVDSNLRIVLDAQVDVLLDAKSKVSVLREVRCLQLILANLESLLEDLGGLLSTDGDVNGDLLIASDGEGANSVTG